MRIFAAAAFVIAGLVAGAAQSRDERVEWNKPVAPFKVIGNVYYVGAAGVSAFLIVTPEGSYLLDGGLPETAPLIARNIATLGFRPGDVKYLMNSHAHYDHAGGLAELKKVTGAAMVASAADAPALRAGGPSQPAVAVDRVIADGESLRLGGTSVTAHLLPGHTKGCTAWTTTVTDAGRSRTVLFHCSSSVVDRLVGNTGYPQIASDYERSFAALRTMQADVFLAPHPSQFNMADKQARMDKGGSNPFVDPAELGRFVDRAEAAFRAQLAKEK